MLKTIILEDDNTPTGGTSFAGETLEDFLLSINAMPKSPLDDADKWHIDQLLNQNGIKPVFNITKNGAFIALYKRLFEQMNAYCEERELTVIDQCLIKDRIDVSSQIKKTIKTLNLSTLTSKRHQEAFSVVTSISNHSQRIMTLLKTTFKNN